MSRPEAIGCRIAQRLTSALTLNGIPYEKLAEKLSTGEMLDIAREQSLGDTLEMPNGATYTLTFKPEVSR